jgi:hypothetical protein
MASAIRGAREHTCRDGCSDAGGRALTAGLMLSVTSNTQREPVEPAGRVADQ